MTYREKAERFRELAYRANGLEYPPRERWAGSTAPERPKWKNVAELDSYFKKWGGRLKRDPKRRRGYLVVPLQEETTAHRFPVFAEVPMDFAMMVLVMGGFP